MKYCDQCGRQVQDEARFCKECGAALPDQEVTEAMETEIKRQGKEFSLVKKRTVLSGIVIALLLVAGGFWSWRSLGSEARVQQKLDLAVKYLSENKFEEAILAYNDAIKIEPKEVKAYQGLAKTYTLQEKYDEAKSTYERGVAVVSSENKPRLRLGLAGMYIDKGDLQEAERYFQAIINDNKTYIDAYRGLALVYQQQGNKDKARAILEQGIKENTGDYSAYNALAKFYADSGDKDKALANIVKSLDLEVNQQEAYAVLADLYKGKWSELINKADSITGTKTAAMLKFYAYYSDEKYSQALTQYKSSLEQDQNNLKARVPAAICMLKNGEKDAASQLINKLVKVKTNSWIMADIARYYQLAGDNKKAIEWANKSMAIGDSNLEAIKILAEVYTQENNALAQTTSTKLIVYNWQPVKTTIIEMNRYAISLPAYLANKNLTSNTQPVQKEPVQEQRNQQIINRLQGQSIYHFDMRDGQNQTYDVFIFAEDIQTKVAGIGDSGGGISEGDNLKKGTFKIGYIKKGTDELKVYQKGEFAGVRTFDITGQEVRLVKNKEINQPDFLVVGERQYSQYFGITLYCLENGDLITMRFEKDGKLLNAFSTQRTKNGPYFEQVGSDIYETFFHMNSVGDVGNYIETWKLDKEQNVFRYISKRKAN